MTPAGRFRKTTDYLGLTKPAESERHPVGSRAWWLRLVGLALFVLLITTAVRFIL